jgi:glycosyltransferase involved in cell wall biosynthesis
MIWGAAAAVVIFGGLSAFVTWQVSQTLRRVRRQDLSTTGLQRWPRAQVVLSLKGTDPFLDRCLARLAAQDYPEYQVTVVVDSIDDPAWAQAVAAQERFGSSVINLQVRTHREATCTRKLNNLLTAFDTLPPAVEVVALCDGDAVVHVTWLKELVAGLNDPEVSAVSANRWYSPTGCGFAELSRHYWNAIAIPATHHYRILWGGSLALRRAIVDEPAFRGAFAQGFADDTFIASYLHETRRRYDVLGATYVVNSETTSVRNYWNFLVRQMLCVRLHHPRWRPIFLHAVILAVAVGVMLPALSLSSLAVATVGNAAFAIYGLTLLVLTSLHEARLRATFPQLQALHIPVTARRIAMALPALLFTSLIYPAATIVAACTRTHLWRGVEYRLVDGKVAAAIDRTELPGPKSTARRPKFLKPAVRETKAADTDAALV